MGGLFRSGFRGSRAKYGNQRCEEDGYKFDSNVERKRYRVLRELAAAGRITELEIKPSYKLEVNGIRITARAFRPDFRYRNEAGHLVVEDVKGFMDATDPATRIFEMKCRLMEAIHGIQVQIVQTPDAVRRQEARRRSKANKRHLRKLVGRAG